jgi:hypothetical protein
MMAKGPSTMTYRISLVLALITVSWAQAEDWPHWRGPHFNGSTSEKNLPANWSTTENIAWSASLPGVAASTPIVWETRVFLSGVDDARDTLQAMCFDRIDGELLWSRDVGRGIRQDHRSNKASPSPVNDGKLAISAPHARTLYPSRKPDVTQTRPHDHMWILQEE